MEKMTKSYFNESDLQQIESLGLRLPLVLQQLETFQKGIPFIRLDRPCTVGDGIKQLSDSECERVAKIYEKAAQEGRAMKFVPASGAATRMFQPLLSYLQHPDADREVPEVRTFFENIPKFPFLAELQTVLKKSGSNLETLLQQKKYSLVLEYLLTKRGLCYAQLPKGLIPFHRYSDHVRSAFEEHLREATFLQDKNHLCRLHFTVSAEHQEVIRKHFQQIIPRCEKNGVKYQIIFSIQKPSTHTLTVDLFNQPFRGIDGRLYFSPSGHGALLENLDEIQGDLIFIKNIDNVLPDLLQEKSRFYEKVLGGHLVELQNRAHGYLQSLSQHEPSEEELGEIAGFLRDQFHLHFSSEFENQSQKSRRDFLFAKLNRPLRVCGMVKNEGKMGGGPYWVEGEDRSRSLQIVERSQIDFHSSEQQKIFQSASHFNPVQLVCGVRDFEGRPYRLAEFSDIHSGFISQKSREGKELKVLERPGLWNGGMAFWNTVFVEVPSFIFSPVKRVQDLLLPAHSVIFS